MKKHSSTKAKAASKAPEFKKEVLMLPPGKVPMVNPTAKFTQALAAEIVKNFTSIGRLTIRPFRKHTPDSEKKKNAPPVGENPILVDTSVLIDARIVPIVNSGFLTGTLLIPQFVLKELQFIADSSDMLRRAKGRRGLDVVNKLKWQKVNPQVKMKVIADDISDSKEVDHKLVHLAKVWRCKLLTVDFNLAQLARAQGIKILNIHDLSQALKIALMPGEEITVKITHHGKEREQGVGYLPDGTMVVVEDTKMMVGHDVVATITKVHQTSAGQLFFGKLK